MSSLVFLAIGSVMAYVVPDNIFMSNMVIIIKLHEFRVLIIHKF